MRLRQTLIASPAALACFAASCFADVPLLPAGRGASPFGDSFTQLAAPDRGSSRPSVQFERIALRSAGPPAIRQLAQPPGLHYDPGFLAALPVASGGAEWKCLAEAIYFEARGEPVRGQFAVAEVILNRSESTIYPNTICGVVHQGSGTGCQFSYTCDGRADRVRDAQAFRLAGQIARLMLDGAPRRLTGGATHFHTKAVRPRWAQDMPRTTVIGHHIFYRIPLRG